MRTGRRDFGCVSGVECTSGFNAAGRDGGPESARIKEKLALGVFKRDGGGVSAAGRLLTGKNVKGIECIEGRQGESASFSKSERISISEWDLLVPHTTIDLEECCFR